ncbi:hypothetical protein OS493_034317 [Desmophyllum pertusum]|uniref:Uncharacterized protein n=1 Tax=Desmophyllum pertusum TaxID=174260 RepID=A0A9X0CHI8_9CNID|nr:hypothetical protein OS493_034317 [Desmophyllum pertusum]
MLRRARERYERELEGPNESRRKSRSDSSVETPQLTRSKTTPYNKDVCFFCDGPPGYRKNLHSVSTFSAGESLRTAVDMSEMTLKSGKVATMSKLQEAFESILDANNVDNPKGGRKALKQLLLREIPEIEFHAPKRVNESERVSIKKTRDAAIQMAEEQTTNLDSEMKTLFDMPLH